MKKNKEMKSPNYYLEEEKNYNPYIAEYFSYEPIEIEIREARFKKGDIIFSSELSGWCMFEEYIDMSNKDAYVSTGNEEGELVLLEVDTIKLFSTKEEYEYELKRREIFIF